MEIIADLHIHSRYAMATSPKLELESIYRWCKIKGIHVIGTADFTHPVWFAGLKEKLELADGGLYKLKPKYSKEIDKELPSSVSENIVRFIPTVEISTIYSKNGRVRKVHSVIVVPTLAYAAKLTAKLSKIGNLKVDGRPILGMDAKDLLKMTLDLSPDALYFPAHIWTPWFSLFGSRSGFDSIEEAYEELAPEIKAVETGLSSDPFMNWRLSQLDNMTLISGSDAHSLPKMGREATVFDCDLDYFEIVNAIKSNDKRLLGTIEFYPQEGRYHYDGHRKCGVKFSPSETKKHKGICPVCGKPLVVGVMYRVDEIADRPQKYKPKSHKKVEYIVPLVEVIAEMKGVKGVNTKTVLTEYEKLYSALGDEFSILRKYPVSRIKDAGFPVLADAVSRMRNGDLHIEPGYDGIYGVVSLFGKQDEADSVECDNKKEQNQIGMF
ncbi:MAG: endonuclease Q family protein [Patescibacteria group bacterium]|nr:endonuclease Q family protein [Patescibacteria group bacterium]